MLLLVSTVARVAQGHYNFPTGNGNMTTDAPATTTVEEFSRSDVFDCEAGYARWEDGWSRSKKD